MVINNVQLCGVEHIKQYYSQRTIPVILFPPKPQRKQFTEDLVQLYYKSI